MMVQTILVSDAASVLAMAGQWLDPVYGICPEGDWESYWEKTGEDHFWLAQNICRHLFPDIYADMNRMVWDNTPETKMGQVICAAINERVPFEVWDFEGLWFGIQNEWYGIDQENIEDSRGAEYLSAMGVKSRYEATIFDKGHIGYHLSAGYAESCPEVSKFVEWLLGISGHDLIDYSYYEAAEMFTDYPTWEHDDLSRCWVLQHDADEHMDQAMRGCDLLEQSDEAFVDFCESIFLAANLALGAVYNDHDTCFGKTSFRRPGTLNRNSGETANDGNQILHLRDCDDSQHRAGQNRENRIA